MREMLKRLFSSEGKEPFEALIDRLILLNTLILIIAVAYALLPGPRINVRNSGAIVMPMISLASLVYVREKGEDGLGMAFTAVIFFGIRELFLLLYYPRPF